MAVLHRFYCNDDYVSADIRIVFKAPCMPQNSAIKPIDNDTYTSPSLNGHAQLSNVGKYIASKHEQRGTLSPTSETPFKWRFAGGR